MGGYQDYLALGYYSIRWLKIVKEIVGVFLKNKPEKKLGTIFIMVLIALVTCLFLFQDQREMIDKEKRKVNKKTGY